MSLVKRFYPSTKVDRTIFFTSDTHFGHKNVIQYSGRPFQDVDEMNEEIVKRWNEVVKPEDVVYHLGDVCLGVKGIGKIEYCKQIVPRLNGHKRLILGNHDCLTNMYRYVDAGFEKVYDKPIMFDNFFILSHEPLEFVPDGWVNIYGHVHGDPRFRTFSENGICACVERHDYRPISMNDIKKFLNSEEGK